ncbi:glycoside hydrolase family 25 protein [Chelativorans alearense]|uniref:glycoside hydrolase family 25 protein n=1 Tax=Chelativorans alearense TaxID=2681495 RepID=UPI0013D42653|nr:GH25 family lysozyme [Chelativorans alearense]
MRLLTVLLLLMSVTACSRVSYDFADLAPSPSAPAPALTGGGLRFADNDPHEWEKRPPWTYPVHGTDVSKYQGEVDWRRLARGGISFAFVKATEGGDRFDETFNANWQGARDAGIARGAYHFYYFCRPAIEQARWFIRHVPRDAAALPPVLDMEWNHLSPSCKLRPPAEVVRKEMQIFLDAVERHYGKRPIIYTSVDFFDKNGLSHFKGYPFWLRSVAGHPDDKYGNHPWVFWQYTGTGVLPGIEGNADINVFHGSANAWREWLKAYTS